MATQQKKSTPEDTEIAGVTYQQEVEQVKKKLSESGHITGFELDFLLHDILMKNLVKWAPANNVPLVDVIKAMDQRRDALLSAVHVSPWGNQLIARVFVDEILKQLGE